MMFYFITVLTIYIYIYNSKVMVISAGPMLASLLIPSIALAISYIIVFANICSRHKTYNTTINPLWVLIWGVISVTSYFFIFISVSNLLHKPVLLLLNNTQAIGTIVGCSSSFLIIFIFTIFWFVKEWLENKRMRDSASKAWWEGNQEKSATKNKCYKIVIGKQDDSIPISLVNKIVNNIWTEVIKKDKFETYIDAINNSKNIEIIASKNEYEKIINILKKFEIVYTVENE